MQKRLLSWLIGVSLLLSGVRATADEPGDWKGREVMLVAADVTFRAGPSPEAAVAERPTGGWLRWKVDAVDGDWLQIKGKWVRRGDVIPQEAAIEYFSDQIERQPTPFALASRAEALKKQRQFDKALADAEEAVRLDPKFALGFKVRGYLHLYMKNSVEALQDFDKALALEPKLATARNGREFVIEGLRAQYAILAGRGAADGSVELDDRRLKALGLFSSADRKGMKGDHRQAIADLDEAARLAPELRTPTFFSNRSHHYFMLREYEKAKADLREAITLEPENVYHHESLGRICMMQQDCDGAIEQFKLACELIQAAGAKSAAAPVDESSLLLPDKTLRDLAPRNLASPAMFPPAMASLLRNNLMTACVQRGMQRLRNGDVAGATADLDLAVETDPKSSFARENRAYFLAVLGDFDRALEDCDAAIRNDRESSSPLCVRGKVLLAKGDFAKALETVNLAVERFPLEAAPLLARAESWASKGEFGRALDDLNYAAVLEPGNAFCYAQRATVLRVLKRDDEAKADFEKAKALINELTKPE